MEADLKWTDERLVCAGRRWREPSGSAGLRAASARRSDASHAAGSALRAGPAAHAAVKTKGSIFELVYRRLVVRLGHAQAIGAIAHRLCRLVWKILHEGVAYEERGPAVTSQRAQRRAAKMIRELRSLGYRIDLPSPAESPA